MFVCCQYDNPFQSIAPYDQDHVICICTWHTNIRIILSYALLVVVLITGDTCLITSSINYSNSIYLNFFACTLHRTFWAQYSHDKYQKLLTWRKSWSYDKLKIHSTWPMRHCNFMQYRCQFELIFLYPTDIFLIIIMLTWS